VVGTFEGCNTVPAGEFTFPEFRWFLKKWRKRFQRRFPGVPVSYIKELTARGTPHLHFVVIWLRGGTSMPALAEFREWNDAAWADVVKSSHASHRKAACRVSRVRSWDRVVHYLSSYLTKGDDRQADSGAMWGCIGKKFFPRKWVEVELAESERKEITRALVRCRRSKKTLLMSAETYSLPHRRGVKTGRWLRFSAAFSQFSPGSFMADFSRKVCAVAGFRFRLIRPRVFRRNGVKLWDEDLNTGKVERRCVESKRLRRFCPVQGKVVEEWVDEIESVAAAWHYLPVSEVKRLLAYVRRDVELGLTACERRWAMLSEVVL
jgi:hypothetical protein